MLEEIGVPYRTELLEYDASMKAPAYLAIDPMGKVPAIRYGDTVVTEGAAICAYLADAFPAAGLAQPPGDRLRGPYYRWLCFGAGPVDAAVTNKALNVVLPPGRERMAGYGIFDRVINMEEIAVSGGEYLAGNRFTAADLYLGSQIGFGMIDKRPALEQYWARIGARPPGRDPRSGNRRCPDAQAVID